MSMLSSVAVAGAHATVTLAVVAYSFCLFSVEDVGWVGSTLCLIFLMVRSRVVGLCFYVMVLGRLLLLVWV